MQSTDPHLAKRHPIQVVSRRSGLSQDVLRAWEKRYGVVDPARNAGGQRLYSDQDIERLRLLRLAVDGGRRISDVSKLGEQELADLALDDQTVSPAVEQSGVGPQVILDCLEAVRRLDPVLLEEILLRQLYTHGSQNFIEGLVAPLMVEIGRLWHAGKIGTSDEHMATQVIRTCVAGVLTGARPSSVRGTVVVATTKGQRHEIGSLLAAVTANQEQWRVVYLGPDLPAEDIVDACVKANADMLALGFAFRNDAVDDLSEIRSVVAGLPSHITLVAGGAAAVNGKDEIAALGAVVVESLPQFRELLSKRVGRHLR